MAHPIVHHTKRVLNKPHLVLPVAIAIAAVIGVTGYLAFSTGKHFTTTAAAYGDVSATLTSSGTVKAATESSLAFPVGGRVQSVSVKVGDTVYAGQELASIDSGSAYGAVQQAEGAYEAAQANYQRLVNGAAAPDVAIAQTAYDTTVSQQKIAVQSAYQKLLSTDLTAAPSNPGVSTAVPTISGTYTAGTQGVITVTSHPTSSNGYFTTSGLVTTMGKIDSQIPQAIGDTGLFILFPGTTGSQTSTWTISIPNTSGANYTADSTAYSTALQAQTNAVAAAQAALDKVKAAPRAEDVSVAEAQMKSAAGALSAAKAALANDFITAPINGIITNVNDLTAGEIVNANTPVIGIMSQSGFEIETYVSEKDLGMVKTGMPVTIVTDAYGPSVVFNGTVTEVALAPQNQADGSSGYKIVYQFTGNDSRVKPGLSATVTLNGGTKTNVLEVPRTALFLKNGASFVLVNDGKKNTERAVTIGLVGTDSVEILSGLSEGEKVVTLGQ